MKLLIILTNYYLMSIETVVMYPLSILILEKSFLSIISDLSIYSHLKEIAFYLIAFYNYFCFLFL